MGADFTFIKLLLSHVIFATTLFYFATLGLAATAKLHSDEGTYSPTMVILFVIPESAQFNYGKQMH